MTDEETRFVQAEVLAMERALRRVMQQQSDHGQQIVIHVQPRGKGIRIQLPPEFLEVKGQG